jgi:ATP-binding cassette subfamily F protein 3
LQTQRIGLLSGGQKSRVAFCRATWDKPHLLLLDEPTNHLDTDTVDALIEAVRAFDGGVVMVSHDQHFIQSCASEIWVVDPTSKSVYLLDGDIKEYKRRLMKALKL